jgi:hypothetical protein
MMPKLVTVQKHLTIKQLEQRYRSAREVTDEKLVLPEGICFFYPVTLQSHSPQNFYGL